jgi:hypothetical protein
MAKRTGGGDAHEQELLKIARQNDSHRPRQEVTTHPTPLDSEETPHPTPWPISQIPIANSPNTNIWASFFGWNALFRWDVLGSVVPGIFVAVGFGVLTMDWFPHNLFFGQVSLAVAGVMALTKTIRHALQHPGSPLTRAVFVLAMCAVIVGIDGYVIWKIQAHKIELKEAKHLKTVPLEPHISAELSVDSTNPKKTAFRVILENVGLVSISSLRPFVHSDSVSWMILVPGQSTMAPHEKTELASSGFPISKRPKQVNVYLLYESDSNALHYSEYSFMVPEIVAGAQPILPTFTKEGSGDLLGEDKLVADQSTDTFQQSLGTLIFFFPEKRPDGSPNQIRIWAKNRTIDVNSTAHKAAVWAGRDTMEKLAEVAFAATPEKDHAIAVVWNDSKGMLAIQVDGGRRIEAVPVQRGDGLARPTTELKELKRLMDEYKTTHSPLTMAGVDTKEVDEWFKDQYSAGKTKYWFVFGPKPYQRRTEIGPSLAGDEPIYIPLPCKSRSTVTNARVNRGIGVINIGEPPCIDYDNVEFNGAIGMVNLPEGTDILQILREAIGQQSAPISGLPKSLVVNYSTPVLIPSDDPESAFEYRTTISVTEPPSPAKFALFFDGPINRKDVFLVGASGIPSKTVYESSPDMIVFSIDSPQMTAATPVNLTFYSQRPVRIVKVTHLE